MQIPRWKDIFSLYVVNDSKLPNATLIEEQANANENIQPRVLGF